MKKFSIYIFGGLSVLLIIMFIADVSYTTIYQTSSPRTKFQYLRSFKNKKIDFIFVGSSRVENGIIPNIIQQKTGKTAVNFGFQAAKLADIYTILQLIKEYNIQYQKILIQVDYIYNITDGHSSIFEYEMTPFIRENPITKEYSKKYSKHHLASYYIPFYRYCSNDLKIGLRELFANMIDKKTNVIPNRGYSALQGNEKVLKGALPSKIITNNPIVDSIKSFVIRNKMKVVFYCAPFCSENKNQDFTLKLKNKFPNFYDFSKVLKDDTMFLNCNHLNDSGATRFTEIITDKLLMR